MCMSVEIIILHSLENSSKDSYVAGIHTQSNFKAGLLKIILMLNRTV